MVHMAPEHLTCEPSCQTMTADRTRRPPTHWHTRACSPDIHRVNSDSILASTSLNVDWFQSVTNVMSRRVTHKCSTLHQCHTYQSRVNITESYYSNVVLVLLQQFLPDVSQISCGFIFQQTMPSAQHLTQSTFLTITLPDDFKTSFKGWLSN